MVKDLKSQDDLAIMMEINSLHLRNIWQPCNLFSEITKLLGVRILLLRFPDLNCLSHICLPSECVLNIAGVPVVHIAPINAIERINLNMFKCCTLDNLSLLVRFCILVLLRTDYRFVNLIRAIAFQVIEITIILLLLGRLAKA